jgi:peptidoglycan/LPS O-acetylase OafA/YrhL
LFGKLESLRGVAACLVVLFHSPFIFGPKQLDFVSNSYLFVDFFFILSGFVMSYAYRKKIEEGLSFISYLILRLGRIYPLHFFLLIVWVPYILIKHHLYITDFGGNNPFETSNLLSFISNLLLLHSMGFHSYLSWNGPSWSISTEFFVYISFYILLVTVDRKNSLYIPLTVSIVCYLFLFNLERDSLDITFDYGFLRCLAAYYLGVFLFRFRGIVKMKFQSKRQMSMLELGAITTVILTVMYSGLSYLNIMCAIASFLFAVAVFSSFNNGFLGELLESKVMRSIGLWSYSIYMTHLIILAGISNIFEYVLEFDLDSSLGVLSILINLSILTITIIVSRFTYTHIEKRFRDLVKLKVNKYIRVN